MKHSKLSSCLGKKKSDHGFTLIELMVVVAIVGILASVAYPSYMNQVRKSRRSDAVAALSAVQQAQERWRAGKTTYASNSDLTPAWPTGLGIVSTTTIGYYTLAVTGTSTATNYTATATAVSGKSQASDTDCTALTVAVTNGNAIKTPDTCWSK